MDQLQDFGTVGQSLHCELHQIILSYLTVFYVYIPYNMFTCIHVYTYTMTFLQTF